MIPTFEEGTTSEDMNERSRLNWHFTELGKGDRLFEKVKKGKKVKIRLTSLGKALVIGQKFIPAKIEEKESSLSGRSPNS